MTKEELLKEAQNKTEEELIDSIERGITTIALRIFHRYREGMRFVKAWDKCYAMINILFDYRVDKEKGSDEKYVDILNKEEKEMAYVAIRQICINTFERREQYA